MITQQHGKALGTTVVLTLNTSRGKDAENLLEKIRDFLRTFEARFSRFQADSELSKLNARAVASIHVSPEFQHLAHIAADMAVYTNGLYDPLLLPELQKAGYAGSWPSPADIGTTPDFRDRAGHGGQLVVVKDSVHIPKEAALDFGGIGKGYALDQIADIIETSGCTDYWVSLGGDVIGRGTDEAGKPWRILLDELHDISDKDAYVTLPVDKRQTVATSTRMKRGGKGWHHLIDPRTGRPAKTPIESASVVAETGALADVMAKCLVIAGDEAETFWQDHHQIAAFVQYTNRWEKYE